MAISFKAKKSFYLPNGTLVGRDLSKIQIVQDDSLIGHLQKLETWRYIEIIPTEETTYPLPNLPNLAEINLDFQAEVVHEPKIEETNTLKEDEKVPASSLTDPKVFVVAGTNEIPDLVPFSDTGDNPISEAFATADKPVIKRTRKKRTKIEEK